MGGCIGLALKIQHHITTEFKEHRKLMYDQFKIRDKAIQRLEFWAVRQLGKNRFQPGVEPVELVAADKNHNDD